MIPLKARRLCFQISPFCFLVLFLSISFLLSSPPSMSSYAKIQDGATFDEQKTRKSVFSDSTTTVAKQKNSGFHGVLFTRAFCGDA